MSTSTTLKRSVVNTNNNSNVNETTNTPDSRTATATNKDVISNSNTNNNSNVVDSSSVEAVNLVTWPHRALTAKDIVHSDVVAAVSAFNARTPTSEIRDTRVLTRTLIGFGGWVVPAHTILVKDRVTARDIALPPSADLYMRSDSASSGSLLAFTDKSVFDVWRQTKPPSDVVGSVSISEYTTGIRLFDALWNSSAVRALSVRSLRVDADPSLIVPLDIFRSALLTAKIERAAGLLTLYRHGKPNAAQRYVLQTFAAFRQHRTFYVVDAEHPLLPRSRLFAFTDDLVLQDMCKQIGIGGPVSFSTLNGAELIERLVGSNLSYDALWLNFHTPLALMLPTELLKELNESVKNESK